MARVQVVSNPAKKRRRRRAVSRRRARRNPSRLLVVNRRRRRRPRRNPSARVSLGGAVGLARDGAFAALGFAGVQMAHARFAPQLSGYAGAAVKLALALAANMFGARVIGERAARSVAVGASLAAVQDALSVSGLAPDSLLSMGGAPQLPAVSGYAAVASQAIPTAPASAGAPSGILTARW